MVDFNPIVSQIVLRFSCPHCGKETTTDPISVPFPDMEGDNYADSLNDDFTEHYCEHCGKQIDIHIGNSICGGFADVEGVDDVDCEEIFDDDAYIEAQIEELIKATPTLFYANFTQSISNVRRIITSLSSSPSYEKQLLPMLYVYLITLLETYLGDTLKKSVLSNPKYKRSFIEGYKDFQNEKLALCNVFVAMENIDKTITKTLNEIIYHNLPKVKGIYKVTLCVDLGDISSLSQAVAIRHDIVHRNCKRLDGTSFEITLTQLTQLLVEVETLISNVEKQVRLL